MPPTADPVMVRFRAPHDAALGARIERVVPFGSRARGDHRPDSDYDVAVFLEDYGRFGDELTPIVDIGIDILFDTGAVIGALPFPEGSYNERTGLMHEMRREGIDL